MKTLKTVKVGQPLLDLVELCYKAGQPLLLIGRHGVGKSECLEQAAEQMEIGFICRDLSLMEPTDLVGMPKLEDGCTTFLPPDFLPTGGKGLMVFEELNRCPRYMRSPCLQLLTARTLNDYILPRGWLPIAAVNPNEGGYEVEDLDKALSSRFVQVVVMPSIGSSGPRRTEYTSRSGSMWTTTLGYSPIRTPGAGPRCHQSSRLAAGIPKMTSRGASQSRRLLQDW